MNKNLPKSSKDIKGKVAIAELRRAHWIIVILALAFAAMLGFVTCYQVQLDGPLSIVVIALLVMVAVVSFGTVMALRKNK